MRRPRRWASEAARLSDAEGYAAAVSLAREADMPRVTRGISRPPAGGYTNAPLRGSGCEGYPSIRPSVMGETGPTGAAAKAPTARHVDDHGQNGNNEPPVMSPSDAAPYAKLVCTR